MKFNDQWHDTGYANGIKGRENYTAAAIEIIKGLELATMLEIGTGGIRLSPDSMTMDKAPVYNPDFCQDACDMPWPIVDGKFDVVVALQVWEHLRYPQKAFHEALRVAKKAVILSVPYKWERSASLQHVGICDNIVEAWTNGLKWSEKHVVMDNRERAIYVWRIEQ
jgi:SAM-dependent methyltransferase